MHDGRSSRCLVVVGDVRWIPAGHASIVDSQDDSVHPDSIALHASLGRPVYTVESHADVTSLQLEQREVDAVHVRFSLGVVVRVIVAEPTHAHVDRDGEQVGRIGLACGSCAAAQAVPAIAAVHRAYDGALCAHSEAHVEVVLRAQTDGLCNRATVVVDTSAWHGSTRPTLVDVILRAPLAVPIVQVLRLAVRGLLVDLQIAVKGGHIRVIVGWRVCGRNTGGDAGCPTPEPADAARGRPHCIVHMHHRPLEPLAAVLNNGPLRRGVHGSVGERLDVPEAVFCRELLATLHVEPSTLHGHVCMRADD